MEHLTSSQQKQPLELKLRENSQSKPQEDELPSCEGQGYFHEEDSRQMSCFGDEESEDCSDSSSVSFEDDILEQHLRALHLNIQSYSPILKLFNSQNSGGEEIPSEGKAARFDSLSQELNDIFRETSQIRTELALSFKTCLDQEDTFRLFLNQIWLEYRDTIFRELFGLLFWGWASYRPLTRMMPTRERIDSYSKDIAFHLTQNDSLLSLSLRQEEPDQLRMLKMRSSFISFLTLTVILVIERYYQNPYLQEDVWEDAGVEGRKKVKTD